MYGKWTLPGWGENRIIVHVHKTIFRQNVIHIHFYSNKSLSRTNSKSFSLKPSLWKSSLVFILVNSLINCTGFIFCILYNHCITRQSTLQIRTLNTHERTHKRNYTSISLIHPMQNFEILVSARNRFVMSL